MTRTEKIANEVYDRHKLANQWPCFFDQSEYQQIDIPKLPEARIQIHSLTGDWTVTRTKDGIHYVHANMLREVPNVSHKPKVDAKIWRGVLFAVLIQMGFAGVILSCLWLYHVSLAVRVFIDKLLSLFS